MCRRPLLRHDERVMLDKALVKVAHYREQHPRVIDTSTNALGDPQQLKGYEDWVAEQRQIDAFLHSFVGTNEQANTALEPTPTAP
jgi:hypothetical protein